MARLGDQLQDLLHRQDVRISELADLSQVALSDRPVANSHEAKLLIRELNKLSSGDLATLKSWTNPGSNSPNVETVEARFGSFEVPPLNGSYFGSNLFVATYPQDLTNATDTLLTTVFQDSIVNNSSFIIWHDEANYQFKINPVFSNVSNKILLVQGVFYHEPSASVFRMLYMDWYRKSDDTSLQTVSLIYAIQAARTLHFNLVLQLNDFTEDPAGLYFTIRGRQDNGSTQGVALTVLFSRFL